MILLKNKFSLTLFLLFFSFQAKAERAIPALSGPVIDEIPILEDFERQSLEDFARQNLDAVQIQTWIISTLDNEPIENLSIRATDAWKLGTEKKDNGVLILVALNDRKMRIEVGQGLEGDIPDAIANRIIRQIMAPNFRNRNYYEGLLASYKEIVTRASGGEGSTKLQKEPQSKGLPNSIVGILFYLLFSHPIIFFIVFAILMSFLKVGGRRSRGFWGGGGSWGGGSSGGWSGGGGGFSGGGSSGDW